VPWAIANAAYKRQRRNPARDGDRENPEPRPLPHDRPRLARGRPDVASTSSSGSPTRSCAAATVLSEGAQRLGVLVEVGSEPVSC
jgi:hypothetical protein